MIAETLQPRRVVVGVYGGDERLSGRGQHAVNEPQNADSPRGCRSVRLFDHNERAVSERLVARHAHAKERTQRIAIAPEGDVERVSSW